MLLYFNLASSAVMQGFRRPPYMKQFLKWGHASVYVRPRTTGPAMPARVMFSMLHQTMEKKNMLILIGGHFFTMNLTTYAGTRSWSLSRLACLPASPNNCIFNLKSLPGSVLSFDIVRNAKSAWSDDTEIPVTWSLCHAKHLLS